MFVVIAHTARVTEIVATADTYAAAARAFRDNGDALYIDSFIVGELNLYSYARRAYVGIADTVLHYGDMPDADPTEIDSRQTILPIEVSAIDIAEVFGCADCASEMDCEDYSNPDGDSVCESCYDSNYVTCDSCDSTCEADDTHHMQGNRYWELQHDATWCDSCFDNRGVTCAGCSDDFHNYDVQSMNCCDDSLCEPCREYTNYCERCDESYCDSCSHSGCVDSSWMHEYSYRPRAIFHHVAGELFGKHAAYHFGVELELSGPGSMADALIGDLYNGSEDDWYAKEDGSVSGVEFVSHPRTLASWQAFNLGRMMSQLRNEGAEDGSDGLHVHISRTAFKSRNHYRRFAELLTTGDDNQYMTEHMAGRTSNSWASFRSHTRKGNYSAGGKNGTSRSYRTPCGDRRYFERYEVLNVTNSATVEFRLGSSTLDPTAFLGLVEFLAAAIEWTRAVDLTTEVAGALTPEALFHFMADDTATYAHAIEIMVPFMASL